MSNFIKRVYPRLPKEQWKNEIKTESVSKDENCINIVELLFPRTGYEFNSRKKQTLHKDVDSFKSMIREEFKDKIDNYTFDNIFHMADDEDEYYELSALLSEYMLFNDIREDGRLLLPKNCFKQIDIGKRKKYKYDKWFFKEIRENSYEDYCELFCEEVFKRYNLKPAFYDLATLDNKDGIISYDFINNKKFISAKDLISEIIESNSIEDIMKHNNYNELLKVILKYCEKHNIDTSNIDELLHQIKEMMLVDIILLQSDRNPNNYGFIIGKQLELAKVFDNSNAMGCNHIEKSPYNNTPLLTVNSNRLDYYNEVRRNINFYKKIIEYIDDLERNIDEIFYLVENKTNNETPQKVKKYIKNTLNTHFNNLKRA